MKRDDEKALAAAVLAGEMPRQAGERLGIPAKRVNYLCLKWVMEGWYDYGVSCDLGWADRLHPRAPMADHTTTEG